MGNVYLGIDAGSTTTKLLLIDEDANIIYKYYGNKGNPIDVVKEQLIYLWKYGDKIKIRKLCYWLWGGTY